MNNRFESIKQTLRRVLGNQRLWAVVAVLAVLLPFVAMGVELAKISGQYLWGLVVFAAITVVWLVTMAVALRVPAKPLPQQQPTQLASQATAKPAQATQASQPAQSAAKTQATRAEAPRKGQQNPPKARSK
ncbi:MAG TPA: hypothetical protein VFS21_16855 [Roseiflexaceae bacterium]|nr:hypothetical protein [Roseiflexaceae bacterium]